MKETRLVRIALFLLLAAVALVYALYFMVRGEHIKKDMQTMLQYMTGTTGEVQQVLSWNNNLTWSVITSWEVDLIQKDDPEDTPTTETPDSFLSQVLGTNTASWGVLSGTELYYGSLELLRTMWLHYEYILKDKEYPIYYAYLGKKWWEYNISQIAKEVWAETVEIYAKNDIINNLYFGDRVSIVTLPNQLKNQTNVFVRMGTDLWLIQDLTGEYRQNKRHIRFIFTGK